jgi:serine protease Do
MNNEYNNDDYSNSSERCSDDKQLQMNNNEQNNKKQGQQEPVAPYRYTSNQIMQDKFYESQGNQQYNSPEYIEASTYSDPEFMKKKHTKIKKSFFKALKFTASAVAFGVIAGAAFQGIDYLSQPKSEKAIVSEGDTSQDAKALVTDNSDSSGNANILSTKTYSQATVVTDVSDVVKKVKPSIVAINASSTLTSYDFFGRQYNEPMEGSGSGIIVEQTKSQLLIVTNNHVIENAQTVEIVFSDGTTAAAVVKGSDANADLAVITVNLNDLTQKTINSIRIAILGNSDEVEEGEMAIAIGNALGYGQSTTVGYISAVNRKVTLDNGTMTLIQTDAAINPGNSGGALLNLKGEVIGINSVKYASEEVEGMGYAIPISDAIPMINTLINRKKVDEKDQGYLGLCVDSSDPANCAANVTEIYAKRYNMPIGIYVNKVETNSPAEVAGLKQGHIIVGVNEVSVQTIDDLAKALSYTKAGGTIELKIKVLENGEYKDKTLSVKLGKREK